VGSFIKYGRATKILTKFLLPLLILFLLPHVVQKIMSWLAVIGEHSE
jgi:hypothetical protein